MYVDVLVVYKPESGRPSPLRNSCILFSSFCCRLLFITTSGLEMVRVKLVSGMSLYTSAANLEFSLSERGTTRVIETSQSVKTTERQTRKLGPET